MLGMCLCYEILILFKSCYLSSCVPTHVFSMQVRFINPAVQATNALSSAGVTIIPTSTQLSASTIMHYVPARSVQTDSVAFCRRQGHFCRWRVSRRNTYSMRRACRIAARNVLGSRPAARNGGTARTRARLVWYRHEAVESYR